MNAFILLTIFTSGYNNFVRNGKNIYIPYNGAYSGGGPAPYSSPFPLFTYKYKPGPYYGNVVYSKKQKKSKKSKKKGKM